MADVFISYARDERSEAEIVKKRLEDLGLTVFLDVHGLDGGDIFSNVIDREVKSAGAVVGLWSPLALSRPWVQIECDIGKRRGVLIPVAIRRFKDLDVPAPFWNIQFVDLTSSIYDPNNPNWSALLRSLSRTLGRPSLAPEPTQPVLHQTRRAVDERTPKPTTHSIEPRENAAERPFQSRALVFGLIAFAVVAAVAMLLVTTSGQQPSTKDAPGSVAESPTPDAAWPSSSVASPTALGFSAQGLAALDARLAQSVADQDVAGLVYILGKGGEIAAFNAHGVQSGDPKTGAPMAKDSIFRIYSMTKPITGVAMMQLFEQGKWAMEDPVTKYAPELSNLKLLTDVGGQGTPQRSPTMRELMTHTAGFGYGLSGNDPVNGAFRDQAVLASRDLDEMMTKIADIPLLYEPGTRWSYSIATDIQGYLVQKLSGQRFGDYLREHVFSPLGMHDTSFFVSETAESRFADVYHWDEDTNSLIVNVERHDRSGFTDQYRLESGGGGLVSTAHDYARFSQMLLNRGLLGTTRLLKPETVDLMTMNHIGDLRLYSDGTTANPGLPGVGFGMDLAVYGDPTITGQPYGKGTYYWGGAAGTWFWIDPANDLFFIGMIQSMGGRRAGGLDFRSGSAELVYRALNGSR